MRMFGVAAGAITAFCLLAGAAQAGPIERTVVFENTYTQLIDDPACGAPFVLETHEVGRITRTIFLNQDGSFRAGTVHDALITFTDTNTLTGASVTGVYSNYVSSRAITDPETGAPLELLRLSGVNFLVRTKGAQPLVSAGMIEVISTVTFDENGEPVFTPISSRETPNLVHAHTLLC